MNRVCAFLAGALISAAALTEFPARANDNIFPPQPAARSAIDFDGRGFLINGQRVFLASAGMEYARVPRALWTDRLMRFKRAGFNCVEVYTFWNFHEPRDGQFDFSGERDLDAFLKLSRSLGLYAIVRVGPYYCAEWDSGGYPVWLRSVPDLEARVHNAAFEQYTTRFWNQLMPIVVTNQIHRGGNVILVQLENEHSSGWGTDGLNDPYFRFLQSTALASGMEVPYFFSGLHHGHDPAGDSPWSSVSRSTPWFSTEFWCDWFDHYGETKSGAREKGWDTWKIIAYGGNGYNYYMAHGGSNFDYYNDDEDAASYDYGAAVGQTGDLRPEYYHFKRAAWFARSFQQILETSDNASDQYAHAAVNPSVTTTARESDSGSILFLANAGTYSQETRVNFKGIQYPQTGSLLINAREMVPLVTDFPLLPDVSLKVAPTRILGITQQADTTTLVIYGRTNSAAELYFGVPTNTTIVAGAPAFSRNGTNLTLQTTYSSAGAANYSFQAGARRVRVLVVSDTLADATWFVNAGGQNYVICGPRYVGDATVTNGVLRVLTERPWQNAESNSVIAFGPGDAPIPLLPSTDSGSRPGAVALASWKTRTGAAPAEPGFDSDDWLASSSGPQQMGADGDFSSYAWYRTTFNAPSTSTYSIVLGNVADHMIPFVDGIAVPAADVSSTSFTAMLTNGNHTLAIFTSHSGRNKLVGYNGAISNQYVKGLSGTAYSLGKLVSAPTALTQWKVKMTDGSAVGGIPPASNAPGWNDYMVGTDAFQQQSGYAWFQTTLPAVSAPGAQLVKFESVDDNAWVYLNGVLVASNTGWNIAFTADLTSAWIASGPNVLSVLVQNDANIGGIYSGVTFAAHESRAVLSSWMLHGGPGDVDSAEGWQALTAESAFNRPQFFKTTFTAAPFETTGPNAMWRVTTSGLSRGSVWVNGHNLGRYPETIPAPGLYIPECWLKPGPEANTLVIFDEEGRLPGLVKVQPENAASRDVIEFRSEQTVSVHAPPSPIGLVAVATGTGVRLNWNPVPGATSYNIKRSTHSGGESLIGVSATPEYIDPNLADGTAYHYVVSSVNSIAESANSEEVTVQPVRWNLAANRPATSDSAESQNPAAHGNDEQTGTRWCASNGNANHWWQVDLGDIYELSGDEIFWERNAAYGYKVAVSTDGTNWTTVANRSGNPVPLQNQTDTFSASGRYVRITVTDLASGNWASFYEFRVFGSISTNTSLAGGCYFIINRNSGQVLNARGAGVTNGTALEQALYRGDASQAWTISELDSGRYEISGIESGLCLEVPQNVTNEGVTIALSLPSGAVNQRWILKPAPEGCYTIQGVGSGLMLRVVEASLAPGASIEQSAFPGNASQWSLVPAAHLPRIREGIADGQFAVQANLFQGQRCVLEASTNLINWWPVTTNTAAGPSVVVLSEEISLDAARRFYRVKFDQ